ARLPGSGLGRIGPKDDGRDRRGPALRVQVHTGPEREGVDVIEPAAGLDEADRARGEEDSAVVAPGPEELAEPERIAEQADAAVLPENRRAECVGDVGWRRSAGRARSDEAHSCLSVD